MATQLRKCMIEDLQLRGMSKSTQELYARAVRKLAEHYNKSPDKITEEELRQYFLYLKNDEVTFKYQDSDTKEWKTRSLHVFEFIRRFLQHVLPKGFQKVKRAGLFTTAKKKLLAVVRYILWPLGAPEEIILPDKGKIPCPTCGSPLMVLGSIPRLRRIPP